MRDLKRRGMRAPVVAVGDSALGFWAAVGTVWPDTREERCWVGMSLATGRPAAPAPKARTSALVPRELLYYRIGQIAIVEVAALHSAPQVRRTVHTPVRRQGRVAARE